MQQPTISLSPACSNDLPALVSLLIDCVQGGASIGFLDNLAPAEALAYWQATLLDAQQGGRLLWLAWQNGAVVGTVQLELCGKANGRHRAEVQKLMVSPQARRQGIAERLMQTLEAAGQAQGRSLLVLDTSTGSAAERLYRRLGWQCAGEIPDFAALPCGTLHGTTLFWKRLPPQEQQQTIAYRSVRERDIAALPGLIRSAFAEYQGQLDPPSSAEQKTEAIVRAELQNAEAWLAERDGQPIGCLFAHQIEGAFYLDRLSVLPAHRGQGIARQLIALAEARARQLGLRALRLSVRISLEQQQAFYRKLGFDLDAYGYHAGYAKPTYLKLRKVLAIHN